MARQRMSPEAAQKIVDDWNQKHPVGTPVMLKRGNQDFHTRTTEAAWVAAGTFPVVQVEGLPGGFELDRIKVL